VKELIAVGGTPPPPPPSPPQESLCRVTPAPRGYDAIQVTADSKLSTGTFEVAYAGGPRRRFHVKVVPWPRGCPFVEPMPDSPVCHGIFLAYQLLFQSYDPSDTKPAGEKLVPGKTFLGRVVEGMDDAGGAVNHLELGASGEWAPELSVADEMPCAK